jgi:hypothetical protein
MDGNRDKLPVGKQRLDCEIRSLPFTALLNLRRRAERAILCDGRIAGFVRGS